MELRFLQRRYSIPWPVRGAASSDDEWKWSERLVGGGGVGGGGGGGGGGEGRAEERHDSWVDVDATASDRSADNQDDANDDNHGPGTCQFKKESWWK